jgi:ADP-L-glycero-D-manno-heptose 6-epimerase
MPEDLRGRYQYFTQATMAKTARAGIVYTPTSLEAAVADYVNHLCNAEAPSSATAS